MLYYLIAFVIPGTDDNWTYFTNHLVSRMVQTYICSIPFYFLNKFIYNSLTPEV